MHALYASVSASVTLPCARIGSVPPLPATIRCTQTLSPPPECPQLASGTRQQPAQSYRSRETRSFLASDVDKWRSAIGWRGTRGPAPRRDASSDSAGGQATSALARMQRVGRCALEGEKGSGGGDLVGGTTQGYPAEGSR
ncbi:hypothetical protein GQ55_3G188700 [Panicum hallii var. hallii]|uniref:Uncharacterized protein n=1 Tax=Panicum hallii var. hallii TaxID=1504633 RepID=A0A2T7EAZ7_9POAL|nr:hypothetical protein GQ55_3G188700 [Panicum hallii var. hallii]